MSFLTEIKECEKNGINPIHEYGLKRIKEAVGDNTFGKLLSNTANKRMLQSFEFYPSTWSKIVNKPFGSRPDFKLNTLIGVEEFSRLNKVGDQTPPLMETIGERSATYKVDTYEKGYQFTRQNLINDDLGAFLKFPARQGKAASRTIDKFVWDFVNDNATLGFDSTALFHANHSNIETTAPLTTANLSKVRRLIANQTEDKTTDKLGLKGDFLIVPTTLEDLGERIIDSTKLQGTSNNDMNNFARMELVVCPWLTDTGNEATCDWYVAASPSRIETIQLDFLRGQSTPQTLFRNESGPDGYDFDSNTRAFKTRYEFGGALAGYRWIAKGDAA